MIVFLCIIQEMEKKIIDMNTRNDFAFFAKPLVPLSNWLVHTSKHYLKVVYYSVKNIQHTPT